MSERRLRKKVNDALAEDAAPSSPPSGLLERWLTPSMESRVEQVTVDGIRDRPWRAAVDVTDPAYRALRASIRASGVLQPLLLRPHADGGFELVSGARRLQAARDTKQGTVPAIVRELGDVEALVGGSWDAVQRSGVTAAEATLLSARLVAAGMPEEDAIALVATVRTAEVRDRVEEKEVVVEASVVTTVEVEDGVEADTVAPPPDEQLPALESAAAAEVPLHDLVETSSEPSLDGEAIEPLAEVVAAEGGDEVGSPSGMEEPSIVDAGAGSVDAAPSEAAAIAFTEPSLLHEAAEEPSAVATGLTEVEPSRPPEEGRDAEDAVSSDGATVPTEGETPDGVQPQAIGDEVAPPVSEAEPEAALVTAPAEEGDTTAEGAGIDDQTSDSSTSFTPVTAPTGEAVAVAPAPIVIPIALATPVAAVAPQVEAPAVSAPNGTDAIGNDVRARPAEPVPAIPVAPGGVSGPGLQRLARSPLFVTAFVGVLAFSISLGLIVVSVLQGNGGRPVVIECVIAAISLLVIMFGLTRPHSVG